MKMLQGLVPGCDKVIGKALLLDEIINYVQSLQNQVEFLSMKLASLNPVLYELGLDSDGYMLSPETASSSSSSLFNAFSCSPSGRWMGNFRGFLRRRRQTGNDCRERQSRRRRHLKMPE
ncbi:unnamed protein product [Spirodela intermedia]|uniref:BHLH domain-containing protein n=1 Tax=Spirodela intermedia TaxID=51605 RepID=A0A7I8IR34_SPIIN|nr:unnamed protein product [Spirodela intermedia]CAA6660015.1 unnamed protein product [Spirodela intermedia]